MRRASPRRSARSRTPSSRRCRRSQRPLATILVLLLLLLSMFLSITCSKVPRMQSWGRGGQGPAAWQRVTRQRRPARQ
eukprot:15027163-Alexandrium_andersonii.AAC.1